MRFETMRHFGPKTANDEAIESCLITFCVPIHDIYLGWYILHENDANLNEKIDDFSTFFEAKFQ